MDLGPGLGIHVPLFGRSVNRIDGDQRVERLMANRLRDEASPYLLQHADNPVDWLPWGDEAFEAARASDRPIFLSVGYSSCHWCHVMAHESFEDAQVAEALNAHFVAVKVDREERPDVDEAYMNFVQMTNGHGGWPMSVFLTPDGKPFFGGTYWPKHDRGAHPGFLSVLDGVAEAWRARRGEVESAAASYAEDLFNLADRPNGEAYSDGQDLLALAMQAQANTFDPVNGGFGGAPKFPPHSAISFLLALPESAEAQEMALSTLEHLALGGIHDHVAGGFHRYSTDARWHLPHFEKMLYDNALLLANYARAARLCRQAEAPRADLFARTASRIAAWLESEMRTGDGLYASALDADTHGHEGLTYVWTAAEIESLLGARAPRFFAAFGVERAGNFRDEASHQMTGENVLHATRNHADEFASDLDCLAAARCRRPQPSRDDKALIGWNGLAARGLFEVGAVAVADRVIEAILDAERKHGRLPHVVVNGYPRGEAYLEDYAAFIDGLLAGGQEEHRAHAARLCRDMVDLFWDKERGGFFGTSERHERLFGRTRPVFDQPVPSANALAVRCLIGLGEIAPAKEACASFTSIMERAPAATEALFEAALPFLRGGGMSAPVNAYLSSASLRRESTGWAQGVLTIEIKSQFHLTGAVSDFGEPLAVTAPDAEIEVAYPLGSTYEGIVQIPFRVRGDDEVRIEVNGQACTETECLPPFRVCITAIVAAQRG